jgi:hypothetical protein
MLWVEQYSSHLLLYLPFRFVLTWGGSIPSPPLLMPLCLYHVFLFDLERSNIDQMRIQKPIYRILRIWKGNAADSKRKPDKSYMYSHR